MDPAGSVADLAALVQGAPAASLILAAMLGASLYGLYRDREWLLRQLLRPYWLVPQRQWASLLMNAFVHADVAHLAFNAFTFWAFAFGLESRIGSAAFVALYALGIAASDLGTWLRHRHHAGYASLGASGAILAVLFASLVYQPTASLYLFPLPVPVPAPVFAVLYLGFSFYASRQVGGSINHDAHLSGAVAGLLFVALTDGEAVSAAWQAVFGG